MINLKLNSWDMTTNVTLGGNVKINAPQYLNGVTINKTETSGLTYKFPGNDVAFNFTINDEKWLKGTSLGYSYKCTNCDKAIKIYNRLQQTSYQTSGLTNILDSFVSNALEAYYTLSKGPQFYSVTPFNFAHQQTDTPLDLLDIDPKTTDCGAIFQLTPSRAAVFCQDPTGIFAVPLDIPLKTPIHGKKIYFDNA